MYILAGEISRKLPFFYPYDRKKEPYIRVAVGDYDSLLQKWSKDEALTAYLFEITRNLTYYYQWINRIDLTDIGRARQATNYARKIMNQYYINNLKNH